MPRKIYDIKPPKTKITAEKVAKALEPKKAPAKRTRTKAVPAPKIERIEQAPPSFSPRPVATIEKPRSVFWPVVAGMAVVFIVAAAFLYFRLPKADVVIWPKVETLAYQQTVVADKNASSIDLANKLIPAQYIQASKTNSQEFPATGNASNEGYATGTITIYNKFNPPESFNFKAGTHFLSGSGKLFVAPEKIVVPAAKKSGGKIIPGSVQVKVRATENGEAYNIAPASFSIPGLKGTAYYYSVYGESKSAMAGGYSGKVKKVTEDDIQGAKDTLAKKSSDEAIAALKSQITSDYVLLDNAVSTNVTNASTPAKVGTVAQNFSYSVTVTANALVFKKSDIEQFAKKYIVNQASQSQTLLDNRFKVNYSVSRLDVAAGKASLSLDFSSGVYNSIDKNSLALSLLDKDADQIKNALDSALGNSTEKIQVNFWPFWVQKSPDRQNAVNVQLKFD